MVTQLFAMVTLVFGVALVLVALAARDRIWKGRLRVGAVLLSLWSGAILITGASSSTGSGLPTSGLIALASIILALAGVLIAELRWDPAWELARAARSSAGRLWTNVASALTLAPQLDLMLMDVATAIRRAAGAVAVYVYKVDERMCTVHRIGSAAEDGAANSGPPVDCEAAYQRIVRACAGRADQQAFISSDPMGGRVLGVPIGFGRHIYAVVLLEDPQLHADAGGALSQFAAIGTLTGRCIHDWSVAVRGRTVGAFADRLHTFLPILMQETCLERALPAVADLLEGIVAADYLSLAWLDGSYAHEDRASMLVGDGRIVENRRRWPLAETTRRCVSAKRTLVTPDLDWTQPEDTGEGAPWEARLGMRSRIVAPIMDGDCLIGSLTLAHVQPVSYGEDDTEVLAILCRTLALWLSGLAARRRDQRWVGAADFVRRLQTQPPGWSDAPVLLREVQAHIAATGLRLFRFDSATREINEVASVGRCSSHTGFHTLSLDHLPWHRCAIASGRSLGIDQSDPESLMSRNEALLTMVGDLKTARIVPVMAHGETLGFLDVMEARDPDRKSIDQTDTYVLQAVADYFGAQWTSALAMRRESTPSAVYTALRDLHREIVNPITSIIGSVELIRHKQPDLTEETTKYLATIERSAARIQDATSGCYTDLPQERDSVARRPVTIGPTVTSFERRTTRRGREVFVRPASLISAERPAGVINGSMR